MPAVDAAQDRPEPAAELDARVWQGIERADHVSTPALVINAVTVNRNFVRLAGAAARWGLKLHPHTKTHKSRMLGRMQLDCGAIGLTVAKVGEAEQMAPVADDVLMAYPAVDRARCARLAELARTHRVRVAIDTAAAVTALASAAATAGCTIGLLVAGTKTLTSDLCLPARDSGHGLIVEYPQAKITRPSEEHGQIDVSMCEKRPTVGECITVVPRFDEYRQSAPPETRTVVFGGKGKLSGLWVDDHYVADYVRAHPDALIGFLSLDPTQERWEFEMQEGHRELGLRGNVYADISALHYRPFQLYHSLMLVQEYGVWEKVLFGTDYPFTTVNDSIAGLRKLASVTHNGLPSLDSRAINELIERDSLSLLGIAEN